MGEGINSLQQRIENEFWEVMIPWMEDSPKIQKLVNLGYRFLERFIHRSSIVFAMMVSSLGLMIGLGIGCILAILF
ncbi:MAG: hypothetical protein ACK2T7_09505 [Anaerolineales bacterium]